MSVSHLRLPGGLAHEDYSSILEPSMLTEDSAVTTNGTSTCTNKENPPVLNMSLQFLISEESGTGKLIISIKTEMSADIRWHLLTDDVIVPPQWTSQTPVEEGRCFKTLEEGSPSRTYWTRARVIRRTRRRYHRCRNPFVREVLLEIYRGRKREFEEGLKEEKRKSWEEYVKEELQQGPWGIPFKIAAGKIRPPTMLSTLKREDGSTTTNWEESARLLMETLLPDDDEEADTEEQRERFHLPMRIIKTYHQAILLSIVGYGACVWAHRLNNVVPARAVRSIQRNVLLRLTGAYRTVATDALSVALGVWPLDLLVKKRAIGYWKRKNNWEKVRILTSPEVETSEDAVFALLREWQRRWEGSETGRRAYQLFPNVVERIDNAHLEPSPGLVQFITGKGPYPESLRKMGLVESDLCECGEVGTPEHVVLECARTLELRRPNQQEVQGRMVGDILRDPVHWRFLDKLAAEASERAKEEYIRALGERRGLRQMLNRRRAREGRGGETSDSDEDSDRDSDEDRYIDEDNERYEDRNTGSGTETDAGKRQIQIQ
uniref:Reverse transcriptase n=1 Tax=Timema tahoe TaxID=61484 RepID=A0A7R9INU8_9NEOP|nr:unnamed protein product [Timema tahoe]